MNILNNRHKIANYSKEYLKSCGFRFKKAICKDDIDTFTYKFPVYKYNDNQSIIDCIITVNPQNGEVFMSVVQQDGNIYAPFYTNDYGNYGRILNIINRTILHEFARLSISVVNEE